MTSKSKEVNREIDLKHRKVSKLLTPLDLSDFPLENGVNQVLFRCKGAEISTRMYLVESADKFIICDIDGTITRSDVRGNIYPIFGKDWTQPGIVRLLNKCVDQGYHICYVTARSISQSETTRSFLENIQQNEGKLPIGPLLMSPDGLMSSFKREVIDKTTQLLKIAILKQVSNLFQANPFGGGLGNKENVYD